MGNTPSARGRWLAATLAALVTFAHAQGYDTPPPPKEPPFKWRNAHGQEVECTVTPWQVIDLGTIGPVHIWAGDHCSVPLSDPVSEHYKKLFSDSCDVHDICYLAPGNDKKYCDDALKWRMDRDCDRAYPGDSVAKRQCHLTAKTWRVGLETPISTTYWERSQSWGRANCHVIASPHDPGGM